jgi:uncharacterized protein (UPF0333 family)
MRNETVALLMVLLVLASGIVGYLVGVTTTRTAPTTNSTTTNSTAKSAAQAMNPLEANATNAKLGLELLLALNATKLEPGQGVNITVEERNALQTESNVTAARSWALKNPVLTECGLLDYSFGIEVLSGHYTASNLSLGQPLTILAPEIVYCPRADIVVYYSFEPLSDNVSIFPAGILPNQTLISELYPPFPDSNNVTVAGYWPSAAIGWPITPFAPGEYTVAAGDEWHQLLLLYFTVQ